MARVLIKKACPFCGREFQNAFPAEGYRKWREGALIQDALPDCTADEREFLITGICPECWGKTFGGD